jgi:YidC/Oxa1 family membrane protein insertase
MVELFNTIIYEPLFNALIWLYNTLPFQDLGVAIILLTIAIKLLLYRPTYSSIKAQRELQEIQPKLDALRAKYKNEKEKLSQELIKFYKHNKVNPFSSCLPLLIQLPILFALYRVFFAGIQSDSGTGLLVQEQIDHLYPSLRAIYESTPIHATFFGLIDLAKNHNIILALLAGGFQFLQSRMLIAKRPPNIEGAKDENMAAQVSRSTAYLFPVITVFFGYNFPAGLALYWVVSTMFTVGQQYLIFKQLDKKKNEEPKDPNTPIDVEAKA